MVRSSTTWPSPFSFYPIRLASSPHLHDPWPACINDCMHDLQAVAIHSRSELENSHQSLWCACDLRVVHPSYGAQIMDNTDVLARMHKCSRKQDTRLMEVPCQFIRT